MRKQSVGLFLVAVCLLVGAVPAQAQFNFTLTTPFAFQVEDKQFPAGAYAFKQEAADTKFSIHSQKGNSDGTFGITFVSAENPLEKDRTLLTFHRYGDKYFLAAIFSRHKAWQMEVSSAEKQLQSSGAAMSEVKLNIKM